MVRAVTLWSVLQVMSSSCIEEVNALFGVYFSQSLWCLPLNRMNVAVSHSTEHITNAFRRVNYFVVL